MRKEFVEKLKKLNPEKLKKLRREKQRRYRQKKKTKTEKAEDQKITHEMQSGNLNYGLEADNSFMTFEEFKKIFPSANKTEYVQAKIKAESERAREVHNLPDHKLELLKNVPVLRATKETCIRYRKMRLGLIPFDALEIDNHNTCDLCNIWYAKNKRKLPARWTGFKLWHGEEKERTVTNKESEKIMNEEMSKLYGEDYNPDWTK
jgi:hypothetical protein